MLQIQDLQRTEAYKATWYHQKCKTEVHWHGVAPTHKITAKMDYHIYKTTLMTIVIPFTEGNMVLCENLFMIMTLSTPEALEEAISQFCRDQLNP